MQKLPLTENQIHSLIQEVKKYPCLWDVNNESYRDRVAVFEAWKEISKTVNNDETLVRRKWKLLRDTFKRMVRCNNITNLDQYTGPWKYFDQMWFLFNPTTETNNDCEILIVEPESNSKFEHDFKLETSEGTPKNNCNSLDDDSELLFFKSLMPYFRALDPIRRLVIRNKIQDMLLNEMAAQKTAKKLEN